MPSSRRPLPLLLPGVFGTTTVSNRLPRAKHLPGRSLAFHTAIALIGLGLGRARVALAVKRVVLAVDAAPAEPKDAGVLGLEAAQLLREIGPHKGVLAPRARPAEDDLPAHDGGGAGALAPVIGVRRRGLRIAIRRARRGWLEAVGRSGEGLERIVKQTADIIVRKRVDGTRRQEDEGFLSARGGRLWGPGTCFCPSGSEMRRGTSCDKGMFQRRSSVVRVFPGEPCVRYSAAPPLFLTFEVFAARAAPRRIEEGTGGYGK